MIEIDRYESRVENGRIHTYAIKGRKEYPMPDAFSAMYDDSHLAIELIHSDMPEVFNIKDADYYIPLNTSYRS